MSQSGPFRRYRVTHMAINTYVRNRDNKTMYRVRLRDSRGDWYGESFARRKDAEQWQRNEKSKKYQGVDITGHKTFKAVAEEWLRSNLDKSDGTLSKDQGTLTNHVLPVFGDKQIHKISATEIQDLVNSWWKPADGSEGYHPETVRRMYSTMRAVFSFARRREYLVADRCLDIKLPRRCPRDVKIPTFRTEEGRLAVDLAPYRKLAVELGDYYGLMVDLALMGLRWGEIAGLQAQDIEFAKMATTVHIDRQLTRGAKGKMVLKPRTKTWRGIRPMTIPATLADKLKTHIEDHELRDGDFLFMSPENEPLHYSNWRNNVWEPARDRAGMGGFTFHDLKHVATKMLILMDTSTNVRERRLANSKAVQDAVYDNATDAEDWMAAAKLEDMVYG
jgi:integrase